MGIGSGLALGLGALSTAGSLGSAAIGAGAAGTAAQQQVAATKQAEGTVQNAGNQALSTEQGILGQQTGAYAGAQSALQPYLQNGQGAVTDLSNLLSLGQQGQGVLAPFTGTFTPPTMADLTNPNDPNYQAYQFSLQQGQQALTNSAAAQGKLFSSDTNKALSQFATQDASQYGQQQYNNALQQYQQSYQQFINNQQSQYGMLAGQASAGQSAVGQYGSLASGLAGALGNTGGNIANISLGIGNSLANLQQGAGTQQASGTVGSANAWSNGLQGLTSGLGNTALLAGLMGNQAPSASATAGFNPYYAANGIPQTTQLSSLQDPSLY